MKTNVITILAVIAALILTSCDDDCVSGSGPTVTQELNIGSFSSISLQGSAEMKIMQGTEQRVEVEGQQNIINQINTDVRGSHWDVFTEGCIRRHNGLTFTITVPSLDFIELAGSGEIVTTGAFVSEDLTLVLSGSGEINVETECEKLDATLTGSGRIEVEGEADESTIEITGSGTYSAFDLETDETDVTISGSGSSFVNVSNFLRAKITGSGDVIYRGSPAVDTDITGSGSVRPD